MFSTFGYEYILSPNVEIVRQTLRGEPNSLDIKSIILNLPKKFIPESGPSINILYEPSEISSLLIALPSLNEDRAMCVFLPGFGEDGKMSYDNLQNYAKPHKDFDARFKLIPRDSRLPDLTNINDRGFGHWMWGQVTNPYG